MDISSIEIASFSASGLAMSCEGVTHVKSLPYLSVVQAVEGRYDISLNGSSALSTGEGGAFIAPAAALQKITHHDGQSGQMRAHWIFLDVTLNRFYTLDDLFEFPVLLPAGLNGEAARLIRLVRDGESLCERYAAAYLLIGLLIRIGKPRPAPNETLREIRQLVSRSLSERLTAEVIAQKIHCSPSQVFRCTRAFFGMTPANYVNSMRLRKAAELLELTDMKIAEIASTVGFDDSAYFSKLFKRTFNRSPLQYRRFYGQ